MNEAFKAQFKRKGMSDAAATVAASKPAASKADGLTDMKITKKERKKMDEPCSVGCGPSGDRYPYGLELRLDDESMKKLGIELPAVGKEISVTAKATVNEASARESTDGGKRLSCTLQITKLKVG